MLSHEEIVNRSIRLNPNLPVNRYTGTLNDPFQEAQSRYMGPGWDSFFGSLAKNQEDAQLAGKNYRVGWGGFGNGVSTQESDMPSRRSSAYASLPGARALDGDHEDLARGIAWNDYVAQSKEQDARQRILNSQASVAEEQARQAALPRESDAEILDRTLAPPMSRELLSQQPGTGDSLGKFTLRPDPTQSPRDRFLASVPGHLRPQVEAQFAASDAKAEANRIDAAKLDETIRKDKATEAVATPFKPVTDEKGAPVTGMAVLDKLSPDVQATVKAVLEGRQALPTGTATKDPYWKGIIGLANQADPNFDAVDYNARAKTRSDFTSGKAAGQINAINTVVGHLHDLAGEGGKLGNTGMNWLNSVYNKLTPGGSERGVTLNNFETLKEGVANELMRVWRQVGAGSEKEIEDWKATIGSSKSPEELKGAFSTIGGMLESKLDALDNQYKQGMGTDKVSAISPESRTRLDTLKGGTAAAPASGGKVTLIAPDGSERQVDANQVDHYVGLGAKRK